MAPVDREVVPMLPIGPFREWLVGRLDAYGSVDRLAVVLGASERRLRVWLRAGSRVSLDSVDRALTREGSALLGELYPELFEFEKEVRREGHGRVESS
jgi:hypothetical protein